MSRTRRVSCLAPVALASVAALSTVTTGVEPQAAGGPRPSASLPRAAAATPKGEWRHYAADAASSKYSPLDQITRDNVTSLEIAWRWKSDNFGPRPEFNWQATPLMIGGVLYTSVGLRRHVVAIDAASGEVLWVWRYDEGRRGSIAPRQNNRGVSYWTDGSGQERILYVTPGYHLISLDAKTGRPDPAFGTGGVVDLYQGLDRDTPKDGTIGSSSPPMIVGDIAVIGAALQAGTAPATKENIGGFVRGFDVRTGQRKWIFHTIPVSGEAGNETWENDSWRYTGNTGVWAPMSADEQLGYVYLPVETPTGDYYGGHRHGDNLYADSLVCLDAKTGKRVWHFQFIHHGVWDWDLPAAPNLVDITVAGKRIKAVAQVTKQGWTYVFDRATGEPVWPIVEKPVPPSTVPGERLSPTQPHPSKPPAFDRQGFSPEDVIDFTPALKAEALEILKGYAYGPLFTPPIAAPEAGPLKGLLMMPQSTGGANWQGAAVDPETGVLFVSSVSNPMVLNLVSDEKRSTMQYIGGMPALLPPPRPAAPGAPAAAVRREANIGPQGLPLVKPLWGRITAIDLNAGELLWTIANGEAPDYVKEHPALRGIDLSKTGRPERSGLLATKTLLFAGEGSGLYGGGAGGGGPMFRAYDKRTGEVVWEFKLPANQTGLPLTYEVEGRQYIVLAVGGRNMPAELVALALPESTTR